VLLNQAQAELLAGHYSSALEKELRQQICFIGAGEARGELRAWTSVGRAQANAGNYPQALTGV